MTYYMRGIGSASYSSYTVDYSQPCQLNLKLVFPSIEGCSSAAKQNIQRTAQSTGQNIYLQKVLHPFWVIAVTFTADSFHFLYLTSLASCLDVLEVNIWILAEVYNGTQEIEQS